jgi:general secretion pathway protein A
MYESYWQLQAKPFENFCDPHYYYAAETHQAAMVKLRYAVENRKGGAVLAGPPGSGKTLIVGMLRGALAEQFSPIVHLVFPQMPCDQLLAYLAAELDGATDPSGVTTVHQSVRRIDRFLVENSQHGRHAVVVIDEAHLIDDGQTLEALRMLLNYQWEGRPGMTLLLAGQPGILPTLDRAPQLEERLGVRCLLRPFSESETAQYVSHRLRLAGATQPIFEPDAIPVLHRLTHGLARRINRLCDLTLLIGYAEQRRSVGAGQIEAVSEELLAAGNPPGPLV